MSAFHKRADMLVLPVRHLTTFVDLTMPKRDWSKYETPTYQRVGKVIKFEHIPALLMRQAS